ncbi:cytochrome P450 family protein [Nucisporomicrobium flavum]|uniref:cytochrome P450 family protein n=1 Tax=Nucisporomicrobium flavum TaxID=2785915 RepID=UPI003C2D09E1
MTTEPLAPFDDRYLADPDATYAELHRLGPAHRIRTPEGTPAWLVTRYEDVRQLLGDPRLARNIRYASDVYRAMPLPSEFSFESVATVDGADHRRLRKFLNQAVSVSRFRAMRPRIEEITAGLIDAMGDSGRTDLIAALAAPLPITVIADMLGVPPADRARFRSWTDGLLGLDAELASHAGAAMYAYLGALIGRKRAEPTGDVLSEWVHGLDEQGRPLDDNDLLGLAFMALLGGYDTTVSTIASSVLILLGDPDLMARLRRDPEQLPAAVEEFLRFHGPVHTAVRRFTTEDVPVGDQVIPAGETVLLSMGAAHRDPAHYPHPERVDLDRGKVPHLAFGNGPHYCPGAEFGRTEVRVALEQVLLRLPRLRLAVPPEQIAWRAAYQIRVPLALPVEY